jgi:hypothetical protein
MIKIKIEEAPTNVLDWLMARVQKEPVRLVEGVIRYVPGQFSDEERYSPSTDPDQGHHFLEDNHVNVIRIHVNPTYTAWGATINDGQQPSGSFEFNEGNSFYYFEPNELVLGDTLLIAGIRCYLISELGREAEVPDELLELS